MNYDALPPAPDRRARRAVLAGLAILAAAAVVLLPFRMVLRMLAVPLRTTGTRPRPAPAT